MQDVSVYLNLMAAIEALQQRYQLHRTADLNVWCACKLVAQRPLCEVYLIIACANIMGFICAFPTTTKCNKSSAVSLLQSTKLPRLKRARSVKCLRLHAVAAFDRHSVPNLVTGAVAAAALTSSAWLFTAPAAAHEDLGHALHAHISSATTQHGTAASR